MCGRNVRKELKLNWIRRERGGAIQKPSKRMKAKWVYTRSCQTHGSSLDSVLLKFKKLLPKCRAAHLRVWVLRRPLQSRLPTALGLQTSSLNTPQIHFTFTSPEGKTPPFLPFIHSHCPNSPLALRTETAAGFLYLKCILGKQKTPTIGVKVHFYVPFLFKIVVQ